MRKLFILLIVVTMVSCTSNERARNYGGKEVIELDKNERLVNITWKQDDVWILTKTDTTKPTTYSFKEKSSYGVMEGEIIIKEK